MAGFPPPLSSPFLLPTTHAHPHTTPITDKKHPYPSPTHSYVAVHFPSEDPPPILAALGLDVPALFKCDPYKEEQEAAVMETTKVVAVASGGGLKEGKGEGDTKATAAGPSLDAAATITATIATAAAAAMAGPTELEQGEEKENKKRLLPPLAVAAVACMGAVGVGVVLVGGWLLFPQTLSVFWPAANGM